MVDRHPFAISRPDHRVEMALLDDVERASVVGAERHEGGGVGGEDTGQRLEILSRPILRGSGWPFPFRSFFHRLVGAGRSWSVRMPAAR